MDEYTHSKTIQTLNRAWLNCIKAAIEADDMIAFAELGGATNNLNFFRSLDEIDINEIVTYTNRLLLNININLTLAIMIKKHIEQGRDIVEIQTLAPLWESN